jgi:hypothetical protein
MTKIVWTATKDEAEGCNSYRTGWVTPWGTTLSVWRQEPGQWGWLARTASGRELPSWTTYGTPGQAKAAAEAWWSQHGQATSIRPIRRMLLGQMRDFLAYTGAEEKKTKGGDSYIGAK